MDTATCADILTPRLDHSRAIRQSGRIGYAMLHRDGAVRG